MYGKKSVIRWMSLSISSSILSLLFVLFHDQLQSYLQEQIQSQMTLQPGTQMLAHWTEPPLEPELYAYIYNITNPKEFISGTDLKIKVSEIGPFVYRSRVSKNVTSHRPGSLTFTSSSFYTFVPEKSIVHHDDIKVTVPNLVILSALMKKETRESIDFVKTNIIWSILTSIPSSSQEPFISLTPNQYLWGYEEDLACIDALEQEDEHEMLFRSASSIVRPKSRFWDPETETCKFGIISQNNNTVSKEVTVDSGSSSPYSKCKVEVEENRFKGRKSLPPDTYDPSCPPSPSSNPLQKFGLMIDFFCGDIRMEADSELSGETQENASLIKRERYVPSNDSFKDLIPLESCFEGVPFYISQPHFYGSSFRIFVYVHSNKPEPNNHKTVAKVFSCGKLLFLTPSSVNGSHLYDISRSN
ncbi:lysosome membrane protein 2 isoform X2 [Lepeophtheirus salmonis]|uniref:lysosome membrane protein 2 isoform X2 n=1 Tax=Lepeophtheirus salmonis TaxID=72036 RepID=UPI001AE534B9|nr:scavenger receptor class B member 1-like isoform X2 [Lepeophtheirus salmonis]